MERILVGVSGGPDSMALLDKLYKKKKKQIFVAHVNYNWRQDSNVDQTIVENYCKKRKINFYILNLKEEDYFPYAYLKNKQTIARKIRYDFYLKQAKKLEIKLLYLAHHRDDFIETAIMQEGRSKDLLYYGIKKYNEYHELLIVRPLLKYYKDDLIKYCKDNFLNFAIDYTNEIPIYERNKIRIALLSKGYKEKEKIYNYYQKINKSQESKRKKIEKLFLKWKKIDFSYDFFLKIKGEYKLFLIYNLLIYDEHFININKNKLEGILNYLEKRPKENKQGYRIKEKTYLRIVDNKIKIIKE